MSKSPSRFTGPQVELHLLRTCLSIWKINHLLRTVSHDKISLQLSRFDNEMRKCVERILRSSLPDSAWSQATLPIRFGGLGLRKACNSYSAAFIGSCNSTRDLSCQLLKTFVSSVVEEEATVSSSHPDLFVPGELQSREHLNSILPANSTIFLTTSKQHDIQVILDSSLQSQIKASARLRDKARLNTISAPFASSWIRAIPNPVFGPTMSAQEYIVCLHLWLGICLFPLSPSSSRCYCGSILNSHGDHVLGCHSGSLRNKRHNALCDIIFHCLRTNNSGTRHKQRGTSANQSRPGDVFHPDFFARSSRIF